MDLVEEDSAGTIIITDFKTSVGLFSKDEVDQNQQLTMYQIAANIMVTLIGKSCCVSIPSSKPRPPSLNNTGPPALNWMKGA
jgi:RecB family exonuclease